MRRWWLGRMCKLRATSSKVALNGAICRPASMICKTVFRYCEASCPTPINSLHPSRIGKASKSGMDSKPAAHMSVLESTVAMCLTLPTVLECFKHRVPNSCLAKVDGLGAQNTAHGENCCDGWHGSRCSCFVGTGWT